MKKDENASEHRQRKREAEEADKVEVAPGVTITSSISTLTLNLVLTHGRVPPVFRNSVHSTANPHRVSPKFLESLNCTPMAFTAERLSAQGQ